MSTNYDALLVVSFGGPEKHDDVIPFLENVLRGRHVPRERMLEVAEHYYHFDGRSPINQQIRQLINGVQEEFSTRGIELPVYWGNRNWHPMLPTTVEQMRNDGIRRAVAFTTSAFGSYSGCRQYRENIDAACAAVPGAPVIDKLPPFWNHPGFIEAMEARVRDAMSRLPDAEMVYSAHSIPVSMAEASPYERQLRGAARLINDRLGIGREPVLVFQSRSGPPSQPWLEPDVVDYIRQMPARRLIVAPIGFLSDHMEVLYDLDVEAAAAANARGIEFVRAATVGTHPRFIDAICEMTAEALRNEVTNTCNSSCCRRAQ